MFVELIGRWAAGLSPKRAQEVCHFVGGLMYRSHKSQRIRKNIHKTFPELTKEQVETFTRQNCTLTVELGLLGLAGRFFSPERWREVISISDEIRTKIDELQADKRGVLFLTPHTILIEAITAMPHFFKGLKPISVLYRAFKSKSLQKTMLKGREGGGMRLLNRTTGLYQIIRALRRGENGGMLFDQKSGSMGIFFSFMQRAATASDLPDILYRRSGNPVPIYLAIKRTGFWRGEIVLEQLSEEGAGDTGLTIAAHRQLEKHLSDPATRIDWLWAHERWNTLQATRRRLGLVHRKVVEAPRAPRVNFLIRLPADLNVARAILPMIAVLPYSRGDSVITIACRSEMIDEVHALGFAKRVVGYPKGFAKRLRFFHRLRECEFEAALGFEGSYAELLELAASGAEACYGWAKPYRCRPFFVWHHIQRFRRGTPVDMVAKMLKKMGIYGLGFETVQQSRDLYAKFLAAKSSKSC